MHDRLLVMATGNAGKVIELRKLLAGLSVQLMTAKEAGFQGEIAETGATFAANAVIKAEAVCQSLGQWALADDSGLEVDALDGEPGVHSARYAGEHASDAENNAKLLTELATVPADKRLARFVSEVALARPGLPTLTFRGECGGMILDHPVGQGGFGYDPLFLVPKYGQTYAELPLDQKNEMSHRGLAMRKLMAYLKEDLTEGHARGNHQ